MNVLRNLKPESSDTREETVQDSDRIWLVHPSSWVLCCVTLRELAGLSSHRLDW